MSTKDEPRCSFCSKLKHEVVGFVAGPNVYICNECVGLCIDIFGECHGASLGDAVLSGRVMDIRLSELYTNSSGVMPEESLRSVFNCLGVKLLRDTTYEKKKTKLENRLAVAEAKVREAMAEVTRLKKEIARPELSATVADD